MSKLKQYIKLANNLDKLGYHKEAKDVDIFIQRASLDDDYEESPEETARLDRNDIENYREFKRSLPKRPGTMIVICPKCGKKIREYKTDINPLNEWAFKNEFLKDTAFDFDGKGCCFPPYDKEKISSLKLETYKYANDRYKGFRGKDLNAFIAELTSEHFKALKRNGGRQKLQKDLLEYENDLQEAKQKLVETKSATRSDTGGRMYPDEDRVFLSRLEDVAAAQIMVDVMRKVLGMPESKCASLDLNMEKEVIETYEIDGAK